MGRHIQEVEFDEGISTLTTDLASEIAARMGHLSDVADAHGAEAVSFTPSGDLVAVNVQEALAELDSVKVSVAAHNAALATKQDTIPTGTYVTPLEAAFAADSTDRVVYVSKSPKASDANDGLSGGKAKATLAGAVAALAGGIGRIQMLSGTFELTAQLAVATGQITLDGIGAGITKVTYPAAGGQGIDLTTSGPHLFRDFTLDGTGSSGSAGALRLGDGMSRNRFERVHFTGWGGGAAIAVILEGALDNTFTDCVFASNARHLELRDGATYPSNQNVFRAGHFNNATLAAGIAVSIINGEGNVFDSPLMQGNLSITTFSVTRTSGGKAQARGNMLTGRPWFEGNGGSAVGSRHILVAGADAANKVVGTIISGALLFASVQDDPSQDIYLEYADATDIKECQSNLAGGHYFLKFGAGVTNTRNNPNNHYAGAADVPQYGPAFALHRSGAGQTIFTGGAFTKVTFNNEDVDTHGAVAASTFTPPVAGPYTFNAQIVLENAVDAESWTVAIYKNGAAIASIPRVASGTGTQTYDVSATAEANGSTDYFEVFISNGGVTARNVGAGSTFTGAKAA